MYNRIGMFDEKRLFNGMCICDLTASGNMYKLIL